MLVDRPAFLLIDFWGIGLRKFIQTFFYGKLHSDAGLLFIKLIQD